MEGAVGTALTVERDGEVRAKHVPNVTAKNVRKHLSASVDKASYLMTERTLAAIKGAEGKRLTYRRTDYYA